MQSLLAHDAANQLRALTTTASTAIALTTRLRTRPNDDAAGAGTPGVSVVIPTFRRPGPLRDAIESALAQTGVDVEVIVVDDSPEGSAWDLVSGFGDDRLRFAQSDVPSGGRPGVPRNVGAALATKEFVHFLDDDDCLADGALAALTAALVACPDAGVAMGIVSPFGEDPAALAHERRYFEEGAATLARMRSRMQLTRTMLFARAPLVNSSCMVRRRCIPAIGGYSLIVRYVEDVDFYLRAVRRFGFVFVNQPVVHYRTGTPSLMHSLQDPLVLRESYQNIYTSYRTWFGSLEFLVLRAQAALARLLWR